ncbi:hypothetical protein F0562_029551 [Nyssa sinensis]|uniref:Uncharacterized protein n=1 Tax=Nyssa sinensis TaxID=561372 RepID=A0A5J5B1F1_9ASTE|nr:hypothetical protein F0562_029551 [Nyssa sinensis]
MQFGLVHSNGAMQLVSHDQNKFVPPMMDVNVSKQTPNTTQQLQGNPSLPLSCGSVQPQQTQKNLPPHVFMKSQEKFGKGSGTNNLNTHGNNFHDRSFTRNPKRDASRSGSADFRSPSFIICKM